MEKKISICECKQHIYPQPSTKFRPSNHYPEYMLNGVSDVENHVYEAVRKSFILLGLDKENIGTPNWNPLGGTIKPGDTVLLKPNLVMDYNQNKSGGVECLYTQPGVVAAVVDYVIIALKGTGQIVIGDAPMQECNFSNLLSTSGYDVLIDYYKSQGIDISIVDFRELSSVVKDGVHYASINKDAKGKIINLGTESEFYGDTYSDKIRITNYDPRILPTHHHGDKQEYYVSDYILNADVIINMPKPKTHRKAGVTISLKNFVGANVRKEFLPHHTMGSVYEKGDEYLEKNYLHSTLSKLLDRRNIYAAEKKYGKAKVVHLLSKVIYKLMRLGNTRYFEGSWYGNHTISRTICDLNKIIYYADKNGEMQATMQRKVFIVADLVVSGEKEGPVAPSPKDVGVVAMGDNPLLFDETLAIVMGFDPDKIPTFSAVRDYKGKYKYLSEGDSAVIVSNIDGLHGKKPQTIENAYKFRYIPTDGWKDHIEK